MIDLGDRMAAVADDATTGVDLRMPGGAHRRRRSPWGWFLAAAAAVLASLGGGLVLGPSGDTGVVAVDRPAPEAPTAEREAGPRIYLLAPGGYQGEFAGFVPVPRDIPAGTPEQRVVAVLEAVAVGPTAEERARGIEPLSFDLEHVRAVRLDEGTLILDYAETVIEQAHLQSDAGAFGILTALMANVFEVPEVEAFELWGNGSCETFGKWGDDPAEPVAVGCVRRTRAEAEHWHATPASPQPAPTPLPVLEPGPALADGVHDGRVTRVGDLPQRHLRFDLVRFLTGDEADRAAGAAGDVEAVDLDYYILDEDDQLRDLVIAKDATIALVDRADCCDLAPAAFVDLMVAYSTLSGEPDLFSGGLFTVTVEGGQVTAIEERYTPRAVVASAG